MKRIGMLICFVVATVIAWCPAVSVAQDRPTAFPSAHTRDRQNVITLQTLADQIKARFRAVQPGVMEREWAQYRDRQEALNLVRSPQNPETALEYMLRVFW